MKKFVFAIVAIVGSLVATPATHAGFLYVDVFDGTTTLSVIDGGLNDLDGIVNNSIIVNPAALLASFGAKIIAGSSVNASSNQFTATADGLSSLATSFTFKGRAGVTSDFTVTAGQTGFTVPGDPKQMDTSGSFTFTNGGTGGAASFQGGVGTTNTVAPNLLDTLIAVSSVATPNPNSSGGNGSGQIFVNGNNPYSMTNVLTAHIVKTRNAVVQGQGTTIVSAAIPEPSTIVMLATMVGPLAVGFYRRRRSMAK